MSCLDATFTLTPQTPTYYKSLREQAYLLCHGADFWAADPENLSSLSISNRFFFDWSYASDPALDYTQWNNRRRARFLEAYIDLRDEGVANKQLALIFGFDVLYATIFGGTINGRLLVYSDAGLLSDQKLVYGDNQFLIEIESLDLPLHLYFIHAGGYWFFKGISGYVV